MLQYNFEDYKTSGTKVNYYYICKRKLWLFSKNICFEEENDRVIQGKVLHEKAYNKEKNKEVTVDENIKLDILDSKYIREIKLSSRMPESDRKQLMYYLYYLKSLGIEKKGKINYTLEKRIEEVELTPEDIVEIEETLVDIRKIESSDKIPKPINSSICKKCSYYEFCYVKEGELCE